MHLSVRARNEMMNHPDDASSGESTYRMLALSPGTFHQNRPLSILTLLGTFSTRIDPVSFDVIGSTAPAMMQRFSTALVGKRFYVLFTMNFLACGQSWGKPPVSTRYLPVLRFDPFALTYTAYPPPSRVLASNQVRGSDVASGLFSQVRYADFSGYCLPDGYVMTFLLTVSGKYNVWVYTDTTASRIVAGSPKVLDVLPEQAVLNNYRAIGAGLFCTDTRLCMANQDTTFKVQAQDRYVSHR